MVLMSFPFYRVVSALCAQISKAQPSTIMRKTQNMTVKDYSDVRTITRV